MEVILDGAPSIEDHFISLILLYPIGFCHLTEVGRFVTQYVSSARTTQSEGLTYSISRTS